MYKYELHMHTREGSACAISTVHDMIKKYKSLGYSGMVVTNHFYCGNTSVSRNLPWKDFVMEYARAYYEGQKTAKDLDFDLIFGIEQGYGDGREILVYGVEPEFIAERPFLIDENLELWSKEIRQAGGFVAYAHPFRNREYIKNPDEIPDLKFADGVEVHNYCNQPEDNEKAQRIFGNSGAILVAGSDMHSTDFESANGVMFKNRIKNSAELAKALFENDFELSIGEK
ncbi:MAG: hypothetical protein E7490_03485 [Ruminococcaceae bacterium]|nr:hypothetical protein [Oscillospiraceae bacterium]